MIRIIAANLRSDYGPRETKQVLNFGRFGTRDGSVPKQLLRERIRIRWPTKEFLARSENPVIWVAGFDLPPTSPVPHDCLPASGCSDDTYLREQGREGRS